MGAEKLSDGLREVGIEMGGLELVGGWLLVGGGAKGLPDDDGGVGCDYQNENNGSD